jgi:hypothetical protein
MEETSPQRLHDGTCGRDSTGQHHGVFGQSSVERCSKGKMGPETAKQETTTTEFSSDPPAKNYDTHNFYSPSALRHTSTFLERGCE